jgi:hypothetical protein
VAAVVSRRPPLCCRCCFFFSGVGVSACVFFLAALSAACAAHQAILNTCASCTDTLSLVAAADCPPRAAGQGNLLCRWWQGWQVCVEYTDNVTDSTLLHNFDQRYIYAHACGHTVEHFVIHPCRHSKTKAVCRPIFCLGCNWPDILNFSVVQVISHWAMRVRVSGLHSRNSI